MTLAILTVPGAGPGPSALPAVIAGGSNHPLLLDDPSRVFRLRRGRVDIFAVAGSSANNRRRHLFQLDGDAILFGIAPQQTPHIGFLAVGSLGSEFESIAAATPLLAADCEGWIRGLASAVATDAPGDERATTLALGQSNCPANDVLRGDPRALRWVTVVSGHVTANPGGMNLPPGGRLPLAGDLQLRAVTDSEILVEDLENLVAGDLAVFNAACREALGRRHLAPVDIGPARLGTPASPLEVSLRGLAGVGRVRAFAVPGRVTDPLHVALGHVFTASRIAALSAAFERDSKEGRSGMEDRLAAIMARHHLQSRRVLLRAGWNQFDGPPLLAFLDEERRPVALVQARGRWLLLDGSDRRPLDEALEERLARDAVQIYPTLPMMPVRFRQLFAFGFVGGAADRLRLLACLVAGSVFAALIPLASRNLIDDALPHGDLGTAGLIVAGLFITVLARTVFEGVKSVAMLRAELRLEGRLQPALVARLLSLPTSFFRAYAVGDIVDRALGIQRARQLLTQHAAGAIVGVVFSLTSLGPILAVDARLALIVLGLALALGGATAALSYGELRHERRLVVQKGKLDSFVLQVLMGITKLRVSAAEPMAFERWASQFRDNLEHMLAAQRWANLQRTAQSLLPELATIALYAAIVVFAKGDAEKAATGKDAGAALSAGAFVALSVAVAQVFGAITGLADALTQTLAAIPLIERARPIIAAQPDVPLLDPERPVLRGEIAIRSLSFRYAEKAPLALDNLDLEIGRGEFVAIVGASGSGKSTLLRLLLGFEKSEQGDIFYDGCSIRRLDMSDLRRQMGVVLQHGKLFSGSIQSNIVGQTGLGMEEAVAAARLVGLDRDIDAMPMGMHTVLLDGAGSLSGGQRQRILIARALVGRPGILLLDEATSALDNRTQAVVTETLVKLPVTRIVIAHRLSTIEAADRIVVLDKGKIAESGSFDDLMARDGLFASHARRQIL